MDVPGIRQVIQGDLPALCETIEELRGKTEEEL